MLNKIKNFAKTNRVLILWTIGYFVMLYLIFIMIFGFDMLSGRHLSALPNVRLRGLGGFAFGALILSALPIYISMAIFAIKNKKIPNPFAANKKDEKKKDDTTPTTDNVEPVESDIKIPDNLPREIREPYIRAARNAALDPKSAFALPIKDAAAELPIATPTTMAIPESFDTAPDNNSALPLPTDFDFDAPMDKPAPMFKEINFGSPTKTDDEIIVMEKNGKKFAIATHDDSDFWTADGDEWFATGKQKPSPVNAVIDAATANDAEPVLCLVTTNIMDIDGRRTEWSAHGIKIINDISEL
ncbi:MAG: hypothetical protein FWF34_00790 [Alphaproteobacteria bacterium]|nr:hypothetical protein [Alphaproteobacteria bacterium]MCL2889782.1 hypothetical protein [Alphaproteobacteria bacterium]